MHTTRRSAVGGIILATAFALAAIPVQAAAEPAVSDSQVTQAIENEFILSDAVDSNVIDVSTRDGVVTLTGTVGDILAKDRAERIAENIVGVRAVVNRIHVLPPILQTDEELEDAVKASLLRNPATDSYEVDAAAEDGVVTLTGTVDSWAERDLCETVVKGVPGVVSVKNDIAVTAPVNRPSTEIAAEIAKRLANDVLVDDKLIEVSVQDSEAVLTGSAGSLAEKNRAIADAWVGGVRAVDADGLDVQWWARDDMRRDRTMTRTDEEIEQAVKDAFLYDPRVASFEPGVTADGGTVVLSGVVDNLLAKHAAADDAANVAGVWRVKNHLKVRPADVPGNEELEKRVADAFRKDPDVSRFDFDIDAYGGVVFLRGDVNTSFEKNEAGRIAERVNGVVDVVNHVHFDHEWTWKPDWEIRADVQDQLFWSPFVDADQVNVDVKRGVVTLTGLVDTWSERRSAEDNAYEAGAKEVRNDLAVTFRQYGPHFWDWPL